MKKILLPTIRLGLLLLLFIAATAHAGARTPRIVMRPELWQSPVPGALYGVGIPFFIGTHMSKKAIDAAEDYTMTARVYHGEISKYETTIPLTGAWDEKQIQSQLAFTPTDTGLHRVELIIASEMDGSYDSLGWTFRTTADIKGKVLFTKSKKQDFTPVGGTTYGSEDSIPVRLWITNERNVTVPNATVNLAIYRNDGRFESSMSHVSTNMEPGATREVILPHIQLRDLSGYSKCFRINLSIPELSDTLSGCFGVNYTKPSNIDIRLVEPGDTTAVPWAGSLQRKGVEYSVIAGIRNPNALADMPGTSLVAEIVNSAGTRVGSWQINTHKIEAQPTVRIGVSNITQQDTGTYRITYRLFHRAVPFDSTTWTYRVVEDSGRGFYVRLVTEGELSYSPADKSIHLLKEGVPIRVTVNNGGEELASLVTISVAITDMAGTRLYRSNPTPFNLPPLEQKTLDLARFHPTLEGVYGMTVLVTSDGIGRDTVFSTFRMQTTSGIDVSETGDIVSVTPNPAGPDEARVTISGHGTFTVSLYDMLGRRISTPVETYVEGTAEVPLQAEGEAPGLYMVRVVPESGEVFHLPLHIRQR